VKSFAAAYTNGPKESYLTALSFRVTFGLGPLSWITLNPDVFVLAFLPVCWNGFIRSYWGIC